MSGPGRPQNPLPDGPVAAVSAELRRQREEARLTYRDLADIAGYSLATVTAACNGRRLPSWKVTRACTMACGGDENVIRSLYEQACTAEGRPVPEPATADTDPPDPSGAATPEQFVACMASLRAWARNPSLAVLNRRSGDHLPPSTMSGVLSRKTLPRRDLVVRYAAACGLPGPEVSKWEAAWDNLKGRAAPAGAAAREETSRGEQPGSGTSPPSGPATEPPQPPRRTTASSVIARVIAFLLTILCAAAVSPVTAPASLATPAAPGPVTVTVQLSAPNYALQGGLGHTDSRALTQTIAWARTQSPHQADRTISTSAGDQVIVSNLLDMGGGSQGDADLQALSGTYLEALDLEGSGTVSTTALTLGGLPAGTAVGLLQGTGRSLGDCSTARWYITSSVPVIPDSTVCIFRPASPGTASLLSIRQRSARAIALGISTWYPQGRPAVTQSTAPGAPLADSSQ
jgi:transcriptional regulator with XRE-family HTH domain